MVKTTQAILIIHDARVNCKAVVEGPKEEFKSCVSWSRAINAAKARDIEMLLRKPKACNQCRLVQKYVVANLAKKTAPW